MSEEKLLREKTATLTRILNFQGTIGMFGHVSVRVPGSDICFISPGASTEKTTVRPEHIFVYNIDGTIAGLIRQDPPNDGTLKAVGKLGVALEKNVGFDILSDGEGGNEAWLMNGVTVYSVDLETGKATLVGIISDVGGGVRDIAILPNS